MARIALVTDSTADLTPEQRQAHGITMVPLNVHIGDETYLDQIDLTTDEFLRRLPSCNPLPTTSQPSPAKFLEVFQELGKTHDAVIAVLLSSKLSGTIQSAELARAESGDAVRIEIIDSMTTSVGLGMQVLRAAELIARDLPVDAIAANLRAETRNYQLIFYVDTLEYLQRGGRIGRAASLVGTILQMKPLLRVEEGQVVPHERTRTKARALAGLREFVRSFPRVERLSVLYSTSRADGESLAASVSDVFPTEMVMIAQFGPVIATHIGPGAVGFCLFEGEAV